MEHIGIIVMRLLQSLSFKCFDAMQMHNYSLRKKMFILKNMMDDLINQLRQIEQLKSTKIAEINNAYNPEIRTLVSKIEKLRTGEDFAIQNYISHMTKMIDIPNKCDNIEFITSSSDLMSFDFIWALTTTAGTFKIGHNLFHAKDLLFKPFPIRAAKYHILKIDTTEEKGWAGCTFLNSIDRNELFNDSDPIIRKSTISGFAHVFNHGFGQKSVPLVNYRGSELLPEDPISDDLKFQIANAKQAEAEEKETNDNLDMVETYVVHYRYDTDCRDATFVSIYVSKIPFPIKFVNSKKIEIYDGYHGLTATIDNKKANPLFWKSIYEKAKKSTVRKWSKAEAETMPFIVYKSDP